MPRLSARTTMSAHRRPDVPAKIAQGGFPARGRRDRMRSIDRWAGMLGVAAIVALGAARLHADDAPATWSGKEPAPGVYFEHYQPSFYTGFAPRTQDPARVHLELSRGNQIRLTLTLGPAELDAYLENLLLKRDLIREMLARDIIRLSTNKELDRFVKALADAHVEETAAARTKLGPEAYRRQTVEIMRKLNPGRVFRIAIPVDGLIRSWYALLGGLGTEGLDSGDARLDAANAILPGRVNLFELDERLKSTLKKAAAIAQSAKSASDKQFAEQAIRYLQLATGGRYPVSNGKATAVEFTAVYPVATAMVWTPYNERKLPDFGVTGVWPLIARTQSRGLLGKVDYISPSPGYGFVPLLAYQHAGGVYYNALESVGVRMDIDDTPFLPDSWRNRPTEADPNKRYGSLWIGSRGPTSRGSTRLPVGHMSELRYVLPSRSESLEKVVVFRNPPQCFDLYDVEGSGKNKVIGLQYYMAYWTKRNSPREIYAPNERKAFYAWLYKGNLGYRKDGRPFMKEVPVCRFAGLHKAAVEARMLSDVRLYEAPYARESVQFYLTNPIRFDSERGIALNRELRRIGTGYAVDLRRLLLDDDCCRASFLGTEARP
jgi:hypothetical protein